MTVFDIISKHSSELLHGLGVTFALCFIVWLCSFVAGSALGVLATRYPRAVGLPTKCLSILFAGMPAIVFLFWLHYPAQAMLKIVIDPFITAAVAISILGVFIVADSMRNVLAGLPSQYGLAGKVCGLTNRQILFRIKVPLITRQILPNFIFIAVTLFHMTLFSAFISVDEIFRVSLRINSVVYRPIEVFTALAVFCVVLCAPLILLANRIGSRYTRDISER